MSDTARHAEELEITPPGLFDQVGAIEQWEDVDWTFARRWLRDLAAIGVYQLWAVGVAQSRIVAIQARSRERGWINVDLRANLPWPLLDALARMYAGLAAREPGGVLVFSPR